MAGRRKKSTQSVSLFPFLSVLACVIGTLTLMITALALGQMDTDEVATLEKYEMARSRLKQLQEAIPRLRQQIAELEKKAGEDQKRLAELRIQLDRLLREKQQLLDGPAEPEPEVEIPVVDTEAHKKRMARLAEELKQLEQRKAQLAEQLAQRGPPPEEASVVIQPSGSGVDLEPYFIECAADSIVIYNDHATTRVRRADLAQNDTFLGLLRQVAERPKARVVFLIRDDGLATYQAAAALASQHYARHGKIPVVGHGKIDLSLFRK